MMGATLDTVTINVLNGGMTSIPTSSAFGLLTCLGAYGNTLKNVNINADGLDIDTLFGTGCWFTYPAEFVPNTFENCVVKAKSLVGLACTDNENKTVLTALNLDGITVKVDKADVAADKDLTIGTDYEYDLGLSAISSVTLNGEVFSGYSFDNGTLIIKADAFSISDVGAKTFKITAKDENGYLVEFNFTVTAKIVAEDVTLSGVKEVVLSDGTEYDLDLGDYSSATVLSAVLGDDKVSYANGKLTLTNEFKENAQKHGNNTLNLTVEKDGKYYNVTANVLVVTKEITTYGELKDAVSHTTQQAKFGYYKLNNDITQAWINDGNNADINNGNGDSGFRGTLDGNNYSITGTVGTSGLIGTIGKGAIIKNITITQNEYIATRNLLGGSMTGATLENVVINVKGKGTSALPANSDGSKAWGGLLTGKYAQSNVFKTVIINAGNTDVDTLFGSGAYSGSSTGNTFEKCSITAKSLLALAYNNYEIAVPYANVNGLTVNLAA